MNLNEQANNVAAQGRFGDSMLLHVNPAEMQGLAQAVPLTINPETGQPEAFLPFLAPILASTIGGAMGLGLLGTSALSGLATWAATGDFKKGLLGAVTGYGMGQAANAFGKLGSETLTQNIGQDLAGSTLGTAETADILGAAGKQALRDAPQITAGGTGFGEVLGSGFNPSVTGDTLSTLSQLGGDQLISAELLANAGQAGSVYAPTAGQTVGNLAGALANPASAIPLGIGLGGTGILESQEMFEADMIRRAEEDEERKRQNYLDNPEQIPVLYSRTGGKQELQGNPEKERKGYQPGGRFGYGGGGGGMGMGFPSGPYGGFAGGGFSGLYNAPAMRTPINIPMGMQSGFMPEFSYFNNLNPSATALTGGQQNQTQLPPTGGNVPFSGVRTADMQDGNFDGIDDRDQNQEQQTPVDPNAGYNFNQIFSPLQSPGYRNFYGGGQGAPYMLNPYAPISSPYSPPRMMPYGGGFGGMRQPFGGMPSYYPQQSFFQPDPYIPPPPPPPPPPAPPPTIITPPDEPPVTPPGTGGKQGSGGNGSVLSDLIYPQQTRIMDDRVRPPRIRINDSPLPPEQGQQSVSILPPAPPAPPPVAFGTGIDQQVIADNPVLQRRMADAAQREIVDIPQTYYSGPKMPMTSPFTPNADPQMNLMGRGRGFVEGGKTEIEWYQEGRVIEPTLESVDTPIPDASNATPQEIMSDPITQELIMFIVGESEDIDVVNTFIDKYGNEAYQMVRESVLQQIAPGSQTQGMIRGEGTGYSDSIPGTIGAREQIAVSNQEYIVPSDVLHAIGDGDVEKGGQEMDQFLARTRKKSTGTTEAPNRVDAKRMLPR